jgi:gliding motility-associated-like protein
LYFKVHQQFLWPKLQSSDKHYLIISISILMLFISNKGFSQSLGDPIVNITFGSGTSMRAGSLAPDSGSTTYTYTNGTPGDGSYTITNTTQGTNPGWWITTDHTGNPGGYFMLVNGSFAPGIFYTRKVTGLCGTTKYQFSAWLKNLLNYNGILPNVSFSIETPTGTVLGSGSTGNIPTGNVWVQYPFTFTTPPGTTDIVLKMTNNAPGGNGNDIAIDDITFRPYGDPVAVVFNSASTSQTFCEGYSQNVTINTTTTLASGYAQKLQVLTNNVWTDVGGATTASTFVVSSPTAAGVYQYRVVSALAVNVSTSNCVVASNQLTLNVQPMPTAAFTVADSTCYGTPVTFTDRSVSNGGTISSWLWDFGDSQTSGQQNPSHTYSSAGDYNVTLTVANGNGCTATPVTKKIHVTAAPAVVFTNSKPDCLKQTINFTDLSTPGEGTIVKWFWDFGDGFNSNPANSKTVQHTYTTSGTYNVLLVITTSKGCVASKMQTVIVSPVPSVNFSVPAVCISDVVSFTDSTTIADNSNLSYLWNFNDPNATLINPNTSTAQNPTHKYSKAAVYQVSLTVLSNNGCQATAVKNFVVNGATPKARFNILNATTLCSNREVFFANQASVDFGNITKIEWYFDYGNNPAQKITDNNPYQGKLYRFSYPEFHTPASLNYSVRMVAYSGGSCAADTTGTITLLATPKLTFTSPAPICMLAGPVQLVAKEVSGIPGTGLYSGAGVDNAGIFNPAVSGAGTFNINYIYTANNACTDTVSQSITVNPNPVVSAGPNITLLQGAMAKIQATATGDSLTYSWLPVTGLNNPNILNPIAAPAESTTYTLTAISSKGCASSSSVTIDILKQPVIPNMFTPNGDSKNDTWIIKYLDTYPDCTVEVFNRNGQKVFYSIGYPIPWDGRYNGADLPVGTYYYIINPKHGRSAMSGSISIMR